MSAANDWGLLINECAIFARGGTQASRWADFTVRCSRATLTCLGLTPGGGEWHVMCGDRDRAQEGRAIFIEQGIHHSHVRVARLSACQKGARR